MQEEKLRSRVGNSGVGNKGMGNWELGEGRGCGDELGEECDDEDGDVVKW